MLQFKWPRKCYLLKNLLVKKCVDTLMLIHKFYLTHNHVTQNWLTGTSLRAIGRLPIQY